MLISTGVLNFCHGFLRATGKDPQKNQVAGHLFHHGRRRDDRGHLHRGGGDFFRRATAPASRQFLQ